MVEYWWKSKSMSVEKGGRHEYNNTNSNKPSTECIFLLTYGLWRHKTSRYVDSKSLYIGEGKASIVLWHEITSPYSYFEEIWIFVHIQQAYLVVFWSCFALDHLTWKEKVCWRPPAMFCLFTHQAKFQIWSMVTLIPWNLVNLSQL